MWLIVSQSCTWEELSNWRTEMSCMPLPSILIRKLCFQQCLSLIHKLKNDANESFFLAICRVQSTFPLVVAFIHVVLWRRRSVAKLNLSMRRKRGVNITQRVISLNLSHQLIKRKISEAFTTFRKRKPVSSAGAFITGRSYCYLFDVGAL